MARRSDFHKLMEILTRQREQRVNEKTRLNYELVARLERIDGLISGIDEAIGAGPGDPQPEKTSTKETGGKIVSDILDFAHILDRARDSERGLVLSTATEGKAINLAQRLNRFRRHERSESRKIYSPDHPSFGKSEGWDTLRVKAEGQPPTLRRS
jgi:hypothetical protein